MWFFTVQVIDRKNHVRNWGWCDELIQYTKDHLNDEKFYVDDFMFNGYTLGPIPEKFRTLGVYFRAYEISHDFFESRKFMLATIDRVLATFNNSQKYHSYIPEGGLIPKDVKIFICYYDADRKELKPPFIESVLFERGFFKYYRKKYDKELNYWKREIIFTETYEQALERVELPTGT